MNEGRVKMTAQKALHEISTIVFRNTDDFEMRISKDCYKTIVNALDKQIPKKTICEVVEIKSEGQQGYIRYLKCPNCKRNIDEENTVHFCTYCGQAIDWSDEI